MEYLSYLITSLVIIGIFAYFALYSNKILLKASDSQLIIAKIYYKIFGNVLRETNIRLSRTANLNKKSTIFKIYNFFDDIIVNLDMKKDNVTVSGLILFMFAVSLATGLVIGFFMDSVMVVITGTFAVFYLVLTMFRMSALLKYEKREAEIMDAVDLLVSDVNGGIYNAIVRYKDSFHPNIRPHFLNFIDDIQNKGYNFRQAMMNLETKLGSNFTDFAQKAILYESKADETLDDIFSSIVEMNRQRRTLRYINNLEFAALRTQFVVSLILIVLYALFSTMMDPFIRHFLANTTTGKLMIIIDIVIIAWVLSYLASIKSKSL